MSDRYGQGLPPSSGWKRDMKSGAEAVYTQADLDFFADNADEYFAMANAERARAERLESALRALRHEAGCPCGDCLSIDAALANSPVPEGDAGK